ncbi:MAG: gliding motility-associated C-terminal domain-containing protein [Sphingobacteriales bacterium]|nr:gliding motility-associated C-terminal domain-containing protein [Sphingobacteriales bacterium]
MKAPDNITNTGLHLKIAVCLMGAFLWRGIAYAQIQNCPPNINFNTGTISSWSARTGLVGGTALQYPVPNTGVSTIPEYNLTNTGIQVISAQGTDPYGSFPLIPTVNGYAYGHSVKMGSTATSWDLRNASPGTGGNPGGFIRAITYAISVPPGPASTPYTMTYAYAMVLENGTHNSNEQPLFRATLSTEDSVITCASPKYYLPTFNDGGSGGSGSTGATLDTATALANGFSLSPLPFLTHTGQNNTNGTLLYDVWTKGWTEVTFDLSAFRGQQVNLTFETVNCSPGGHFAYAYVAVRNTCAGLEISGNPVACTNSTLTYSIPALAGALYNWTVPPGWTINSGANSNILTVTAGSAAGYIIAREINGCADLLDSLAVTATPPTAAGQVSSDNTVCSGVNSSFLTLGGQTGNVLNWISSTDGVSWSNIANTALSYTAQNLTVTTRYKAIVQNGTACRVDTSTAAIVTVDPKSAGGVISPANTNICLGQNADNLLTLTGHSGSILNWQVSFDNTNWAGLVPAYTSPVYQANGVNSTRYYRSILKSGVCPADTSTVAAINFINVPYPSANTVPDSVTICYGKSTTLKATIAVGTNYTWSNASTLSNQGSGTVTSLPQVINAVASPRNSTDYIFSVTNAGCPNILKDTFRVVVKPRIVVFAGNDTAVVANQPLQLEAVVSDPAAANFSWTPGTGLNFTNIYNPVATLNPEMGTSITYLVRATNPEGCFGEDDIKVTIFKTGPDIFVPTAFTPNHDGLNDIVYPICVGIKQLEFFRVFNRWGQLVFSTNRIGQGWDGRVNGLLQDTNNFVFMVQGTDYTGKTIFKKGNITLIR